MRLVAMLSLVAACGGAPSDPVGPRHDRAAMPTDAAIAGADAAIVVATPDSPQPPTATLENIVVAGELDAAKVSGLLGPLAPELAACLGAAGPTTTELSLTIIKDEIGIRNAWQHGATTVPMCLRAIFPDTDGRPSNVGSTTVYVVVKAGPPGSSAPDASPPGSRRAEFQRLFCDLEALSGATNLSKLLEKRDAMTAWARDHIKHPAPLQVASDVRTWNPAERADKLVKAVKAEGIQTCAMQRF